MSNCSKYVRDTIRSEMRALGLAAEPPQPLPTDSDAEGEVLSAVLVGDITVADLAPLEALHFYSLIHRAIWTAAGAVAPGDVDGIREHLIAAGWFGALDEEFERLMLRQPWRCRAILREQADRIIELSKRRHLIQLLQRIEADLRTDRITEAAALAQLRGVTE